MQSIWIFIDYLDDRFPFDGRSKVVKLVNGLDPTGITVEYKVAVPTGVDLKAISIHGFV